MSAPKEGDLRVAHFPQVPCKPFIVPVSSPREGALVMRALADYDLFQLRHRIKPDFCNAQTLETFEDGEWCDWTDDEGNEISDVADALLKDGA